MVGSPLPEPILSIALDAVEKIQSGQENVSALWSVFSRIKNAIEDGHRLENMSWRLWHLSRVTPNHLSTHPFSAGLPRFPDLLRPPLASPSLSFSSSSEGTATNSDWDRDTAVGEDDEVQQTSGARRKAVISPPLGKSRLHLSSYTPQCETLARHSPSLAPWSHSGHQLDPSYNIDPRDVPSARSESAPHHRPHLVAATDVSHERIQANTHQGPNPPKPTPGLSGPASSPAHTPKLNPPYTFLAKDLKSLPIFPTRSSAPSHIRSTPASLSATFTSSSVPISLPSFSGPRTDKMSVHRIFADLFPIKKPGDVAHPISRQVRIPVTDGQDQSTAPAERGMVPPEIVEPEPSGPATGANTSLSTPPSSSSAATSATTTPRQVFPTVVVVNPTPHPTPPATPSPSVAEDPSALTPTVAPFNLPERKSGEWSGAANGQLATPVSLNGDARSFAPAEPTFVMMPKPLPAEAHVTVLQAQTSPLPVSTTPPSERLGKPSSHTSTPSSQSTPASPVPAPAPEDKRFFLTAPHSGSGHESSESPESLGGNSVSPEKAPQMSKEVVVQAHAPLQREEEVVSSFSTGSPGGRAPSVGSSRGGQPRLKSRVGFAVPRRRQVPKKIVIAKQSARRDAEVKQAEEDTVSRVQENEQVRSKGKERAADEKFECSKPALMKSAEQPVSPVKQQQRLQHLRSPVLPQQSQNLRQLPTNPPRQLAQSSVRRPASHAAVRPDATQQANTRQPLYHPQFGHLGLGHLPTVPPRNRRQIEITETSSEYETTDTDESSWESESFSGDDGEERSHTNPTTGDRSRSSGGAVSGRTRDAGEFQRDAEREAQRARELFQKLPLRTYSNLGQLPRAKSGLSLLFHPDPEAFPEGHPYRISRDSRDILARNWSAPVPPRALTTVAQRAMAAGPTVTAEPVVASVTARQNEEQRSTGSPRGVYRRRGPPQDQEHETDSGEDDPEDVIQVSSSIAQRRLAAIMSGRPGNLPLRSHPTRASSYLRPQVQAVGPQPVTRTTTAPVLMHPYLPDPAPLQTPHTVRRNIIAQELDEELRRNLLWERSQNQIQGRPAREPGSILQGPWLRVTALRPEESTDTQSNPSDKGPGKRSFATQRTKSWAGDYHASGW